MAKAMTLIGSVTLTSAQTSITFANIPQDYRDLYLVGTNKVTSNGDITFRFNGDNTSTNYWRVYMFGNGSTPSSGSNNESYWWYGITTDSGTHQLHILDYSATDKHKTVLARGDISGNGANATAGRWASTAAITSMTINVSATTGATYYLYGVLG